MIAAIVTAGAGEMRVTKTVIWPLLPAVEIVEPPKAWLAPIRAAQLTWPVPVLAPKRTVLAAPSGYREAALGSPCGTNALAL